MEARGGGVSSYMVLSYEHQIPSLGLFERLCWYYFNIVPVIQEQIYPSEDNILLYS